MHVTFVNRKSSQLNALFYYLLTISNLGIPMIKIEEEIPACLSIDGSSLQIIHNSNLHVPKNLDHKSQVELES